MLGKDTRTYPKTGFQAPNQGLVLDGEADRGEGGKLQAEVGVTGSFGASPVKMGMSLGVWNQRKECSKLRKKAGAWCQGVCGFEGCRGATVSGDSRHWGQVRWDVDGVLALEGPGGCE